MDSIDTRGHANDLDPTLHLERLNGASFEVAPTELDFRPFMRGWSPSKPHKDYSRQSAQSESASNSAPWHPGYAVSPDGGDDRGRMSPFGTDP